MSLYLSLQNLFAEFPYEVTSSTEDLTMSTNISLEVAVSLLTKFDGNKGKLHEFIDIVTRLANW